MRMRLWSEPASDKSEQVSEDSEQVLREILGFFRGLVLRFLTHCNRSLRPQSAAV